MREAHLSKYKSLASKISLFAFPPLLLQKFNLLARKIESENFSHLDTKGAILAVLLQNFRKNKEEENSTNIDVLIKQVKEMLTEKIEVTSKKVSKIITKEAGNMNVEPKIERVSEEKITFPASRKTEQSTTTRDENRQSIEISETIHDFSSIHNTDTRLMNMENDCENKRYPPSKKLEQHFFPSSHLTKPSLTQFSHKHPLRPQSDFFVNKQHRPPPPLRPFHPPPSFQLQPQPVPIVAPSLATVPVGLGHVNLQAHLNAKPFRPFVSRRDKLHARYDENRLKSKRKERLHRKGENPHPHQQYRPPNSPHPSLEHRPLPPPSTTEQVKEEPAVSPKEILALTQILLKGQIGLQLKDEEEKLNKIEKDNAKSTTKNKEIIQEDQDRERSESSYYESATESVGEEVYGKNVVDLTNEVTVINKNLNSTSSPFPSFFSLKKQVTEMEQEIETLKKNSKTTTADISLSSPAIIDIDVTTAAIAVDEIESDAIISEVLFFFKTGKND